MDRRHSLAALLCFLRLTFIMGCFQCAMPSALADVGNSASGRAVRPCVAQSSLDLTNFPDNMCPDEIMTGTVATQSYLSPTTPPASVFSTLWIGIDLPALWFWFVAVSEAGWNLACNVKAAPASFGAGTVISLYALLRGTWGDRPKHDPGFQRFECSLQPPGA
jgi:hypothetical protein